MRSTHALGLIGALLFLAGCLGTSPRNASTDEGISAAGSDIRSINFAERVARKPLRDGSNLIDTTDSGMTLSAIVKKGEIIDWRVADIDNRDVDFVMQASKDGRGGEKLCKVLVCAGKGRKRVCFEMDVPCEDIVVVVKTPKEL
jgi:hypothetical protein